ncbi:MAG: DUF4956 domain-containing protein [Bacilli bacterium]|nr:DUF4956 domain-containing protein [Bacilli bacterium]
MFNSIFSSTGATVGEMFAMLGAAIGTGLLASFLLSLRMKSSARFYITIAIIPAIVGIITALTSDNAISVAAAVSVSGAFALVRFRSAQGNAEEIIAILLAMAGGLAFGAGYLAYAIIFMIGMAVIYIILTFLPIFGLTKKKEERMLIITIPEDLNYHAVFEDTLNHFTSEHRLLKAKTTNMGSMYRLSYKVTLKNVAEEKEMIDDLRMLNGNLEITVEAYDVYSPNVNSL